MIVEKGKQVRFATGHDRAVEHVADPKQVRGLGLEAAMYLPRWPRVDLFADEVPLEGPLRRSGSAPGDKDPAYLRRGTLGVLRLQRDRQIQRLGVGAGQHVARGRAQRLKATRPVGADPPIQTLARCLHRGPGRSGVHLVGDAAHQCASLFGRQLRLQRLSDQPVPEQRDLLGPGPPHRMLIIDGCHRRLHCVRSTRFRSITLALDLALRHRATRVEMIRRPGRGQQPRT